MEAPERVQPWGRVKRRREAQVPGMAVREALWRVDPVWRKSRGGEQEGEFGTDVSAMFRPRMTVGERAEPEGRLEPSSFFAGLANQA